MCSRILVMCPLYKKIDAICAPERKHDHAWDILLPPVALQVLNQPRCAAFALYLTIPQQNPSTDWSEPEEPRPLQTSFMCPCILWSTMRTMSAHGADFAIRTHYTRSYMKGCKKPSPTLQTHFEKARPPRFTTFRGPYPIWLKLEINQCQNLLRNYRKQSLFCMYSLANSLHLRD